MPGTPEEMDKLDKQLDKDLDKLDDKAKNLGLDKKVNVGRSRTRLVSWPTRWTTSRSRCRFPLDSQRTRRPAMGKKTDMMIAAIKLGIKILETCQDDYTDLELLKEKAADDKEKAGKAYQAYYNETYGSGPLDTREEKMRTPTSS